MIEFILLTPSHPLWEKVAVYAENCSWSAGPSLARDMRAGAFSGWERVIAAVDGGEICGYCTVAAWDCIPNLPYTPYIGYVFIDEAYRGRRLSQRMLLFAMDYLKKEGFPAAHLISDHENLYEKFEFEVIDRQPAPWGSVEKIYRHML